MDNRKFAVILWSKNADTTKDIFSHFPEGTQFDIFAKNGKAEGNAIELPKEIDTMPKAKNFVFKHYKDSGFTGFLHLIEDNVEVLKDPMQFIEDIEKTMSLLDINSFFSTVTDGCNRVYSKYNPRLRVVLDKLEYEKLGIKDILFCSHSNTAWIVMNIGKADEEELHFREEFEIAMYWIIEYLARRRNSHPGSLYFMNQYVTCSSELDVFKVKPDVQSDDAKTEEEVQQQMQTEDGMFKSLGIDYHPDNNIDVILEALYEKLQSKVNS